MLYCYVAALDKALDTRGARYDSITAKATVEAGSNDKGQGRILGIILDVTVHMDADYEDIFERVSKVMRHGCLISASLEAAFIVTYTLALECPDDEGSALARPHNHEDGNGNASDHPRRGPRRLYRGL